MKELSTTPSNRLTVDGQWDEGWTVAQVLRRQERGRTKLFTGVALNLSVLKKIAFRQDPTGNRFPNICRHSSIEGMYEANEVDPDEGTGNIFGLMNEIRYLKYKTKSARERDEIRRWEYTIQEALKEDFNTFWLGYIPKEQYDRVV